VPGLDIEIREAVASLTLLDAGYSVENLLSIAATVHSLERRDDVRAIVLRGGSSEFFIGASVPLLEHMCSLESGARTALIREGQDNVRSLLKTPKLTVAYVDGFAAGGGVDLMLACDIIAVTPRARVNLFYSKLGVVPDDGALYLVAQRVGWPRALRLAEESSSWDAQECISLGLADRSLDASLSAANWARALRRELRVPASTHAALKSLRWSQNEAAFEQHLEQVAALMSDLLVQPEQQALIARTSAAQRMQAAAKEPAAGAPAGR
jgi:2-(1,2-epoxy-1,2-dihydrophenyl)acetyl-CoA isomerase